MTLRKNIKLSTDLTIPLLGGLNETAIVSPQYKLRIIDSFTTLDSSSLGWKNPLISEIKCPHL